MKKGGEHTTNAPRKKKPAWNASSGPFVSQRRRFPLKKKPAALEEEPKKETMSCKSLSVCVSLSIRWPLLPSYFRGRFSLKKKQKKPSATSWNDRLLMTPPRWHFYCEFPSVVLPSPFATCSFLSPPRPCFFFSFFFLVLYPHHRKTR